MTPLVPTGVYLATLGVLGLLIGSFLNVVIYRVPAGLSWWPRARPAPTATTPSVPTVPVVSWPALRALS